MTRSSAFDGFPALTKGTAIPNLFFAAVLPKLRAPGDLLAFLWASRLIQEQRGEARFVTADQLWAEPGAAESFEAIGGGRAGLDAGLDACAEAGVLLSLELAGPAGPVAVYFVHNAAARRAIARARSGDLELRPQSAVMPARSESQRPGIFRLYEEQIGTITPLVGERLMEAEATYPEDWIEDAFREAAELNARSWRYVERILMNWAEEGRPHETAGRDSFEGAQQRFFGDAPGHIARYR